MKSTISASLMCADLMNLQHELTTLHRAGVDAIHFDFMDGQFVPNVTFGTAFLRAYRETSNPLPLDIHIMAYHPETYFDAMEIRPGDTVSIHYEATDHPREVLQEIRRRGASPLLALNPDTPLSVIPPLLQDMDGVVIMTVYPGDSGKPLVEGSFQKIAQARVLIDTEKVLEVDGCVSWANAPIMHAMGANMFVEGTSSIFETGADYTETVAKFTSLIQ